MEQVTQQNILTNEISYNKHYLPALNSPGTHCLSIFIAVKRGHSIGNSYKKY